MKNKNLVEALRHEEKMARSFIISKKYAQATYHLERLHILGQRSLYWHTHSHRLMLWKAYKEKNVSELIGQMIRLPLGMIGSALGIVPTGNTGSTQMGLFEKKQIPEDLKIYLK